MAFAVDVTAAAPVSDNDDVELAPIPGTPPRLALAPLPPVAAVVPVVVVPLARENDRFEVAPPPLPPAPPVPTPPLPPIAVWFNVTLPAVVPETSSTSDAAPPATTSSIIVAGAAVAARGIGRCRDIAAG